MKKATAIASMLTGLAFVLVGFTHLNDVPDSYIALPFEYINGDAYNYLIEASLRAGEIAQARIVAAIYLVGGAFLLNGGAAMLAWIQVNKQELEPEEVVPTDPDPAAAL